MTAAQLAAAVKKAVPGSVTAHEDGLDMPTLTVKPEKLVEVATHLRDAAGQELPLGRDAPSTTSATARTVAGYFGTERGRDINRTGSWGTPDDGRAAAQALRGPLPRSPTSATGRPSACASRCWLDDGQEVPSVVAVWPTADWHEREQYDLMGIHFAGHPNLRRLIMPTDWAGHPHRKDYPIGGEPVQFTDAV